MPTNTPAALTPQEIATRNASLDRNRQALVAALLPWQQGLMPAVSRPQVGPRQPPNLEERFPRGEGRVPAMPGGPGMGMQDQPLRGIVSGPFAGGGLSAPVMGRRPWETLVRDRRAIA